MEVASYAWNELNNNRMLANDELYVVAHEHPVMSLTSDLFDGRNFHSWCRAIKRGLFARNKLGFIGESLIEPSKESIDHMQWVNVDYLVFNWLCNSVVKELSRGLQHLDTSQQLWDELHRRFGKQQAEQSTLYFNQHKGSQKEGVKMRLTKEEKMKLKCDYCGRTRHVKNDCFEVIGIPDWYKRFKEEKGKEASPLLASDFEKAIQNEIAKHFATYLHNKGQQDVPSGLSGAQTTNLAETDDNGHMACTGHYVFGLSTEIHQDEWIMDSGGNNHMCCKANLLTNIRKLKNPIRIYLLDGTSLWELLAGDAQITPSIKLLGVLYAPEFTHNLISVGQMTRGLSSRVIFLETHCLIQKKNADVILGIGKLRSTLYILKHEYQFTVTLHIAIGSSLKEYHELFGHPSVSAMKHLDCFQKRYREEDYQELKSCDICQKAKQQRNPFPTLGRRSESIFHLVHVDVRGAICRPCKGRVWHILNHHA
ncbi:hypothetical protein C2S51_024523 [Perilla frutescens var. frutescens]|nr:hypothetical protein C2S51_024523 [Perilla frutescens var. frutescens]